MKPYDREEQIYSEAVHCMSGMGNDTTLDAQKYSELLKEYGNLLRRVSGKPGPETGDKYDRDYLDDKLGRIMNVLSRSNGRLSVLMIDIDSLGECNDKFGHTFGDECIGAVYGVLRDSLKRADDFVARYGGDEFVAVLPSTGEDGARMMANRLAKAVKNISIPSDKKAKGFSLSVTIGATTGVVKHTQRKSDYINRADEALINARKGGQPFSYLDLSM